MSFRKKRRKDPTDLFLKENKLTQKKKYRASDLEQGSPTYSAWPLGFTPKHWEPSKAKDHRKPLAIKTRQNLILPLTSRSQLINTAADAASTPKSRVLQLEVPQYPTLLSPGLRKPKQHSNKFQASLSYTQPHLNNTKRSPGTIRQFLVRLFCPQTIIHSLASTHYI